MRALFKILAPVLAATLLTGCLVSLPGVGGGNQPSAGSADADHIKGEVLVRLADGVISETSAQSIAESVGGSAGPSALAGCIRVKLPSGADLKASIAALEERADVAYAEPVYVYKKQVIGSYRVATSRAADLYANQWGPESIGADKVWELNPDCSGITVGVVDTGIDRENPELGVRIIDGQNFVAGENSEDFDDKDGHGTHVAGIIGAAFGDEKGIRGMAGDVRFVAAKVLGPEGGTNDEVAAGIRWAADRAQVINLSLGGWGRSQAIQDAVDYALSRDVIVVAAMGNGYSRTISHYPAACEGVIAVGATKYNNTRADFSNTGPHISVAAPGVNIISCIPGPSYATWSGTSMAAPHVTGLVALLLSRDAGRKPTMIRTLLERYATNNGEHDENLGWGVINALAAYKNSGSPADAYGGLEVVVRHEGNSVANAGVMIRDENDAAVATNRTNVNGVAYFHYLKAGSYKIYATKVMGSMTLTGENSDVSVNEGVMTEAAVSMEQ